MTGNGPDAAERSSRNIFISIFVCLAVGLILAGFLHYRHFEADYRTQIGRELSAIAALKASEVAHYRKTQLGLASFLADNSLFSGVARRYFADPRDADAEKRIRGWLGQLKTVGEFDCVRLLDARGATRLSFPASLPALPPPVARHAAETMRTGRAGFSDLYRDARDNRVYLSIEAPIFGAEGDHRPLGLLALRMDPETELYPFLRRWPTPASTAETLLVGRDGNDALYLNPLKFRGDAALKLRTPLSMKDVPAVRAVLGRTGVSEGRDYRGEGVLADTRPIPDSPWFLVTRIDVSEFSGPLHRQMWTTALFVLALLLAAAAAIALAWKRRAEGFRLERISAAETLRESEARLKAITESALDAIIMMDPGGLISYWNPAAQAIFGYTKEEALGRDLHELLMPQRYRDAQQAGLAGFHLTGRGAALDKTNKLKALRKGGEEFDISLSMSAVNIGGQWHAVGIVRDITEQKKAETALRENDRLLAAAQELAHLGSWELDLADNRLAWSDEVYRIFGLEPREFPASYAAFLEAVHPDDRAAVDAAYSGSLREGRDSYEIEHRVMRKGTGEVRFVHEKCQHVRDSSGRGVRSVGMVQDITERKKAEHALLESSEKINLLLNSAAEAIYGVDRDGNCTFCNNACLRLLGYKRPEELLGKNMHWQIHSKRPDGTPFPIEECRVFNSFLKGEEVRVDDEVLWRADGTSFPAEYWSYPQRRGGAVAGAVVSFFDITERRKAEQELRKLALAVKESPASIVLTDAGGIIEYVNPKFTEVTGYSLEEAVGQNPRILKSGEQSAEFYQELWETITSGEIWRGEFHNIRKDGRLYWEAAAIAPIIGAGGRITNYVAVKEDITGRKVLEAELLKAKEAAEAANRAKSSFLANMSHEIRTPLNAILGFSQLLRRDPETTPGQKQHLETINRSGEHLLALINDILEIAKVESGRTALNPAAFDLHALIDDVEKMLRPRAEAKGLRQEVERGAGLPRFATTDEGKLRQILLNLLSNAVKYTVKGAIIMRVTARPGPAQDFILTVKVEDTGPGIAPGELARLFRPFEQAHTGIVAGGGTGLGLAISRNYARLMGGDITALSRPGEGSVFTVEIPLHEVSAAALTRKSELRLVKTLKPGQPRYRVLVADDTKDNRDFISQLLEPIGFELRQAVNGEEALKEFAAWRPQLILMDLRMPGMDGYEAMRRVRAGAGGKEAKIIAVTANVFGATPHAMEAGADELLLKPFRESELLDKIRSLLGAEYIYEEEVPAAGAGPAATGTPKPASLAGLPQELVSRLREAVGNGDFELLAELSVQAEAYNSGLAGELRGFAEEYDLQGILALLAKETPYDG